MYKRRLRTVLLLAAGLVAAPSISMAETASACSQTLFTDAKAVSTDLSAIAAQANAQGFRTAVEAFASYMESILPSLNKPSQEAVQKFVTDLENAVSDSSPGGTTITAGERLVLTADWANLISSANLTPDEIATISNDLIAVMDTLQGISTAQLQTDLKKVAQDAQACVAGH